MISTESLWIGISSQALNNFPVECPSDVQNAESQEIITEIMLGVEAESSFLLELLCPCRLWK